MYSNQVDFIRYRRSGPDRAPGPARIGASRGDGGLRKSWKRTAGALALAVLGAWAPAEADEQAQDAAKAADAPKLTAGPEGFALQSASGDFRLQLRGYAQFDGRFFSGDEGKLAISTFALRRVRPLFQGTLGKSFEFQIMPDFGGGTTVLQDAWLDFKPSPKLRVRVGKYKAPVGLERLQSATALTFVERAFPTLLVPNRDLGVMVHGELSGGIVAYAAGVFDGAPDGGSLDVDLSDSKDLAGRVFLSPFRKAKSALQGLGFGIAGTTGRQSGPLPAYRSSGLASVISILAGVTADGTRQRYSPQLSFYSGPFGLLAEYARSESWVKKADAARVELGGSAWEVTASVSLTSDTASYAGTRPKKPFDPAKAQWGALDLVARVHGLELDRSTYESGVVDPAKSARKVFAWAVGLNWSMTRNIKQVVDFERATFEGGAAEGGDRAPENAIFIRTQLSF
jgi:phosphate-selective porin OprO/OprP